MMTQPAWSMLEVHPSRGTETTVNRLFVQLKDAQGYVTYPNLARESVIERQV